MPAVDRAVRVLRAVCAHERDAPDRRGVSLSELSRELGVSKSTVSALLATLERHGLLHRDAATLRFRPGLGLVELAAAVVANADAREAARPQLALLRERSGETAILHLVSGDGVTIAERAEPAAQLKVVAPLGTRLPRFAGSVAKVLLAAREPGDTRAIVRRYKLPSFTPQSIVDADAYLEEVERTRRRGYASEDEEYLVGVGAVSAPVIDHEGQTIGTISIAGVKTRVGEHLNQLATPVIEAAAQTSLRLGAPGEGRWQYRSASSSSS